MLAIIFVGVVTMVVMIMMAMVTMIMVVVVVDVGIRLVFLLLVNMIPAGQTRSGAIGMPKAALHAPLSGSIRFTV